MAPLVTPGTELAAADHLLAGDLLLQTGEGAPLDDLPGPAVGTLPQLLCVRVVLALQHPELDTLHLSPGRDHGGVLIQESLDVLGAVAEPLADLVEILRVNIGVDHAQRPEEVLAWLEHGASRVLYVLLRVLEFILSLVFSLGEFIDKKTDNSVD